MSGRRLHKEEVKAKLRMKYGSMRAFAHAHGVSDQLVKDFLRGQSGTIGPVVLSEIGFDPRHHTISIESTLVVIRKRNPTNVHGEKSREATNAAVPN